MSSSGGRGFGGMFRSNGHSTLAKPVVKKEKRPSRIASMVKGHPSTGHSSQQSNPSPKPLNSIQPPVAKAPAAKAPAAKAPTEKTPAAKPLTTGTPDKMTRIEADTPTTHLEEKLEEREVEDEWSEVDKSPTERDETYAEEMDQSSDTDIQKGDCKEKKTDRILVDDRGHRVKVLERKRTASEKLHHRYLDKKEDFRMLQEHYGQLKQDHEKTQNSLQELQGRFKELEQAYDKDREALQVLRERHGKLEKDYDGNTKNYRELQERHGKLKGDYDKFRKNIQDLPEFIQLKQEHDDKRKYLRELREHHKKLIEDYDKAQETVDRQRDQITELTAEISSFHGRGGTTTRDDDYFEAEFAKLMGSIQQWVFRYFGGPSDVKLVDFPPAVQESVKFTVWSDREPEIKVKEIQAVVGDILVRHIIGLSPFWMPPLQELGQGFRSVYDSLEATDLEKRKWHAETVEMISNNNSLKEHRHRSFNDVTTFLNTCLDIRITRGSNEHREQGLLAIVEHAAELAQEINRQVDVFQLNSVRLGPGSIYHPDFMEDVSGIIDDEEKDEQGRFRGVIVQKLLFPMVLRYGFDGLGQKLKNPVVVRKAVVEVARRRRSTD